MTESPVAVLPGRRATIDSTVRTAAFVTLWLSLLLVTYWWVAGGGVQELAGWATGLTSLGRLTGLLAAVLLLAQVVLMARVPTLEPQAETRQRRRQCRSARIRCHGNG